MNWRAISGFRLVTRDLEPAARFYAQLGFTPGESESIAPEEMTRLGLHGSGRRLPMQVGRSRLELDCFDRPGRSYPEQTDAASPIFQHLALVVDDAAAFWARAKAAGAAPISLDGPVTLPASSGGVTAVKFRDPEGHPLEFLQFPEGADHGWSGSGLLGIDHSAISVRSAEESQRFYAARGLKAGKVSLNHGPTQVALDGLEGARVEVVPLNPAETPPHLELLAYIQPAASAAKPPAPNDMAATRIIWRAGEFGLVCDPDGHLHQLEP